MDRVGIKNYLFQQLASIPLVANSVYFGKGFKIVVEKDAIPCIDFFYDKEEVVEEVSGPQEYDRDLFFQLNLFTLTIDDLENLVDSVEEKLNVVEQVDGVFSKIRMKDKDFSINIDGQKTIYYCGITYCFNYQKGNYVSTDNLENFDENINPNQNISV